MEQNVRGVLAYIFGWLGGVIVLFGLKDNEELTKFHACQSITMSIVMCVASALSAIPFVGILTSMFALFMFVLAIIGAVKAYKNEEYELPVISDLTRNIFKSQLSK